MIYVLEDDESIRELIIYTLNGQKMEAKGFFHSQRVLGGNLGKGAFIGIAGHHAAGGGRLFHFGKAACRTGYQALAHYYADRKGQRI